MQRRIKFRAWDMQQKKMIENPFLEDEECYGDFSRVRLNKSIEESNLIFMQFTGLCDKNGKEIYEGDIVTGNTGETAEIKWNKDGFYPCLINHEKRKVIGNIYENPELLKN